MGESVIAQRRYTNSGGTIYHYQVEMFEFDVRIPRGTFDLPPAIAARVAKNEKRESSDRSGIKK
jgi:hypothetical protein